MKKRNLNIISCLILCLLHWSLLAQIPTGTVTDYDGNSYSIKKYGNYWWMVENLRTTRYNDGTSIPTRDDLTKAPGSAEDFAVYYKYPNNNAANIANYGLLYSWNVAFNTEHAGGVYPTNPTPTNICPTGWSVPSRTIWATLGTASYSGDIMTVNSIPSSFNPQYAGDFNTGGYTQFGVQNCFWTTELMMPGAGYGCKILYIASSASAKLIQSNYRNNNCRSIRCVISTSDWDLSYSSPTNSFTTDIAITDITPTVHGSVQSFSVSPALPAGLTLNTTTGVINGTPTESVSSADYSVTAHYANGTVTFPLTIEVNDPVNVWNGVTWSSGVPSTTDSVRLDADYNSDGFSCGELTIKPGVKATFNSDVTITGDLVIKSGATVINKGALNVAGITIVQQYLTGAGDANPNGRFWYVTPPVGGAKASAFIAGGKNKLWEYNELTQSYTEISDLNAVLTIGKGYVVRLGTNDTISFSGSLASSDEIYTPSCTGHTNQKRGFNLIGNPYVAYLDWDEVCTSSSSSDMLPTYWIRTINEGGTMIFGTYNAASKYGTNSTTKFLSPLQAFWVKVDGDDKTGNLALKTEMRSHQTGVLKSDGKYPMLRLAVSNGINSDEAIVVFAEEASDGFDKFDSPKMHNNDKKVPELYMNAGSEELAINGLKSMDGDKQISLGFRTMEHNTFNVSLNQVDGLEGYSVGLIDNLTKDTVALTETRTYTFVADSGDFASRFTLVLKSNSESTDISMPDNDGVFVNTAGSSIVISTPDVPAEIFITDLSGRMVKDVLTSGNHLSIDVAQGGLYFVGFVSPTICKTVKVIVVK